jgi:integrase
MDKFERGKRCPGLVRRRYETTEGEKRFKFYARFTCKLKHKRRCEPLGSDEKTARALLQQLLADNLNGKDFDAVAEPTKQGITFREWAKDYFANKIDPEKHAGGIDREKRSYKALEPFFGDMLLSDIKRSTIMEYRAKRLNQPIMRRGKAVEFDGKQKKVSFVTVNRELAFLRAMLNLAEDDEVIEQAPRFKSRGKNNLIKTEKGRKRDRGATADEFRELCENMPRPALRVLAALHYTAMRVNEVIRLPWSYVDEKAGFIRLPASYVKEKKPRSVPICPELSAILNELRQEQKRVASISGRVFTRNGRAMKSIRTAFEDARGNAGIEDLRLHDMRHTAITRWATMGIPPAAIMAAAGHHSIAQSGDYTNMKDEHLKLAFNTEKLATQWQQGTAVENASAASY